MPSSLLINRATADRAATLNEARRYFCDSRPALMLSFDTGAVEHYQIFVDDYIEFLLYVIQNYKTIRNLPFAFMGPIPLQSQILPAPLLEHHVVGSSMGGLVALHVSLALQDLASSSQPLTYQLFASGGAIAEDKLKECAVISSNRHASLTISR